MTRRAWIGSGGDVAVVRQCELAGVSRATVYAQKAPSPVDQSDLLYSQLIDEEYTRHPFYGTRRMVVFLGKAGHLVNRKRVQHLMRRLGRWRQSGDASARSSINSMRACHGVMAP